MAFDRSHLHLPSHFGERAADAVAAFAGSWLFIGIHATWFAGWILLHVEPFPFGLLTMIVSLEAIFLSTIIMLSQNRQNSRDHKRDDQEADEVRLLYEGQKVQQDILTEIRTINENQTKILTILHDHIAQERETS